MFRLANFAFFFFFQYFISVFFEYIYSIHFRRITMLSGDLCHANYLVARRFSLLSNEDFCYVLCFFLDSCCEVCCFSVLLLRMTVFVVSATLCEEPSAAILLRIGVFRFLCCEDSRFVAVPFLLRRKLLCAGFRPTNLFCNSSVAKKMLLDLAVLLLRRNLCCSYDGQNICPKMVGFAS